MLQKLEEYWSPKILTLRLYHNLVGFNLILETTEFINMVGFNLILETTEFILERVYITYRQHFLVFSTIDFYKTHSKK